MTRFLQSFATALLAIYLLSVGAQAAEPENTLLIELKDGTVEVELLPQLAHISTAL